MTLNLNLKTFWLRWNLLIAKSTTLALIALWWAAGTSIHVIEYLPEKARTTIIAILLATSVSLLFKIYDKVRDTKVEPIYKNFLEAKEPMEKLIKEISDETSAPVKIQFLGVAMYMGYEWITDDLCTLVRNNSTMRLEIEICMIAPEFLKDCGFDTTSVNWPQISQMHLDGLKEMMHNGNLSCGGRLQIKSVYIYRNLPHWHGILIGDQCLYLSRCNWEKGAFEKPAVAPQFLVGQQKYRFYQTNDSRCGGERIAAFKNWFRYYSRTAHHRLEIEHMGDKPLDKH